MKICLNMFQRQLWYLGVRCATSTYFFKLQLLGQMLQVWCTRYDPCFLVISRFADEIVVSRLSSHKKNRDPPRLLGLTWYHLALYKYLTHTVSMTSTSNDSFYHSIDTHHYESNGSFGFQNTVNLPRKKWSLLMGQITICFSVPFQPRFSKPHLRAFSRHRVPVSPYSAHRKCPSHKPKCSGYDRQMLLTCRNIRSPGKLPNASKWF